MTAVLLLRSAPGPLDLERPRREVDAVLHQFLQGKAASAAARNLPEQPARVLEEFIGAGGKRLRPVLCALGWQAATGAPPPKPVVQTAAALEMFHAFCLIHDDIIDNSTIRRGRPTVHRTLATHHTAHRPGPIAKRLGASCALLVGDLALTWADELLHTAGLTHGQLAAVLPVLDTMRTEVIYGRYLDVTATGEPSPDVDRAMAIIRYKTAKYACERPLHIGALLGRAAPPLLRVLSAYAMPLGEAFQLRDDILGVYGRPDDTGKPVLDDLREGKHTVLIALAAQRADTTQRRLLSSLLGAEDLDQEDAARICTLLDATGARAAVEDMITARYARALTALDATPCPPPAAAALRRLAARVVERTT